MDTKLAIFQEKSIRKIIYEWEWYFSVVDIIWALDASTNPRKYWNKLKERLVKEWANELVTNCHQLKLLSSDGKKYKTDCVNTKNAFRLIQSIPSKKAEPFKMWLAQVWKERIDEIENPELAMDRMKKIYEKKWYDKDWIEKRARGIAVRHTLTDEWQERWIKKWREYAILTAEISKATFGMSPSEYRAYKWLDKENLRDHMTDLELIFNMLWEASTTNIMQMKDSEGFEECKKASKQWWEVAGNARKDLESRTWNKISTKQNYLWNETKKINRKKD